MRFVWGALKGWQIHSPNYLQVKNSKWSQKPFSKKVLNYAMICELLTHPLICYNSTLKNHVKFLNMYVFFSKILGSLTSPSRNLQMPPEPPRLWTDNILCAGQRHVELCRELLWMLLFALALIGLHMLQHIYVLCRATHNIVQLLNESVLNK